MQNRMPSEHDPSPPIEEAPSKRRRLDIAAVQDPDTRKGKSRRKNACQSCRLRKIKCDNVRPSCGICQAVGSSCLYTDSFVEKVTLESVTELLSGKLDKLQDDMDLLQKYTQQRDGHPWEEASSTYRDHGDADSNLVNAEVSQTAQSSSEFQHIPAQRTTADAVLRWDIFEEKYPPSALIALHFARSDDRLSEAAGNLDEIFTVRDGVQGPNEEDVPALVESFLRNVHTKNPVLDADQLVRKARLVAGNGLGWDGWSCLVLLAAALGRIARPFEAVAAVPTSPTDDGRSNITWGSDMSRTAEALNSAEGYFGRTVERLEECMYWSCFKSEIELRVELPLPQSELASDYHPQMFPCPRSPARASVQGRGSSSAIVGAPDDQSVRPSSSTHAGDYPSPRDHVARLWNEEESWYYYLTEIALRRIGNRIINTFFRNNPSTWLDVKPLLRIALEFDTQVSAWSANLPTAMKQWETSDAIKRPEPGVLPEHGGNHVMQELSWALENRLLEVRSWLYQPFIYWLVHSRTACATLSVMANESDSFDRFVRVAAGDGIDNESATALYHLIVSGIECNLKILDMRSLRHRHHGLWYDLRSTMCAALLLLTILKSGKEAWIPGGAFVLRGRSNSHAGAEHFPIVGKIGHVMAAFEYWEGESPDLKQYRQVLEDVVASAYNVPNAHEAIDRHNLR
ncbi:hypothetical protein LTR17_023838 [Elasticomyces elasticus]|nr:hypothetical protein LTR17_023838 [Elasticomyces elasticus]